MYKNFNADKAITTLAQCGFASKEGHITVICGDTYPVKDQLKAAGAKYKAFGWYFEDGVAVEVPEGCSTKELTWDMVNGKTPSAIKNEFFAVVREPSKSEFQGEIGGKITVKCKVMRNYAMRGYYGESHMHTFEDENGNVYLWTTTAKNIPVGTTVSLSGIIKDHNEYKETKQTILTRCHVEEI